MNLPLKMHKYYCVAEFSSTHLDFCVLGSIDSYKFFTVDSGLGILELYEYNDERSRGIFKRAVSGRYTCYET